MGLDIAGLGSLAKLAESVIKRIWKDPAKQAEEMRKIKEMELRGASEELQAYLQVTLAQIEVNKEQAKHPSIFVSGGRPAAIWAGVFAMCWTGIFHPMLMWAWAYLQATGKIPADLSPPPLLDTGLLATLLGGLLGVSGMRSYDGIKGSKKDSLK